jgi:hypothetical protein
MKDTVDERSWKTCFFVYLASLLWKGVLRLARRVNSISGWVVRLRGCRRLKGIDGLRSEVDGTYGW